MEPSPKLVPRWTQVTRKAAGRGMVLKTEGKKAFAQK
nr:MAG TPA: hypothetical protein [Caudoviricetes sp.]